jgi:multidrug transporter EmrE-like cation transporter
MMKTAVAWALVAGTVCGLAVGQILFKLGAIRLNSQSEGAIAWVNLEIISALIVYMLSTVLWVTALRALPLRIAYPVSAFGFVLVPVLGHYVLKEPLTVRTLIGAVVIIAGVAISTSQS